MIYGDFKDLNRRTNADKVLSDKAFNFTKKSKYDGYKRVLASMAYTFFDKKTSDGTVENKNFSNKELAKELHKAMEKENGSTLTFYKQYLGHRSSRYTIDK